LLRHLSGFKAGERTKVRAAIAAFDDMVSRRNVEEAREREAGDRLA
jgi:hypothetical protein